ncbi:MAG: lysoplasmalogenase [Anaerolineales bacterium]|jgi:uncharacterized membrane protein YhhN
MIFLILAIAFAAADWYAVSVGFKRLEYVAKPAAMLFLILWYATRFTVPSQQMLVFLLALALSLCGDIFLMWPTDEFIKGLASFLLAQISYIVAFNYFGVVVTPVTIGFALLVAVAAYLVLRRILAALRASGKSALVIPIIAYAAVLSGMLWSAMSNMVRPGWTFTYGLISAVGAGLFFASDISIAWNRFVGPTRGGRLFEMVAYHLAQFLMSLALLLTVGAL